MKKYLTYISIITIFCTLFISDINSSTKGIINGTGVRLRSKATTSSSAILTFNLGDEVTIAGTEKSGNGCNDSWYKVSISSKTGYVCGEFVTIVSNVQDGQEASTDYEKVLKAAGFPSSYWPYLTELHKKHPNWVFKVLNTGISFSAAAAMESKIGVSLLQGDEGYRSTDSSVYNYYTNKWVAKDGTNWYAANQKAVEYYLDPRNWLNENTIFMFEDLSYNEANQKREVVSSILSTTKLKNYDSNYVNYFMEAAKTYNVSPVYLASRVRQEVGTSTAVISGGAFTYNNKTYSKLYNPYNIGATSGADNWKKGLVWANGGVNGKDTTYLRPWNTLEKGIKGGANYIVKGYISQKQNTNYLQKFNVANGLDNVGSHQYMTNLQAPSSEATTTASKYKTYNIINESLVFQIPVYNNMPSKTSLPAKGNPNNYLKTLKVDNQSVTGFDGAKTSYTINVAKATKNVNISATKVVNSGSISGTGNVTLSSDKTTRNIVVTAQNGAKKTYTITILRNAGILNSPSKIASNSGYVVSGSNITNMGIGTDAKTIIQKLTNNGGNVSITNSSKKNKNSGRIATGDMVTISNGTNKNTYTVIVHGDSNGDGIVNSNDYVRIKNTIMSKMKLTGVYYSAADVNKDGKVTSVDYVNVKNYILGRKSVLK